MAKQTKRVLRRKGVFPDYRVSCLPIDLIPNNTDPLVYLAAFQDPTDPGGGNPFPFPDTFNWIRTAEVDCGDGEPRAWRITWTPPIAKDGAGHPWDGPSFMPADPSTRIGGWPGCLLRIRWGVHGVEHVAYIDYGRGGSVVVQSQTVTVDVYASIDDRSSWPRGAAVTVGATISPATDSHQSNYSAVLSVDTGTITGGGFNAAGLGVGWVEVLIPPYAKAFRFAQYLNTSANPTDPIPMSTAQADDYGFGRVRQTDGTGERWSNTQVKQSTGMLHGWPPDGWIPVQANAKWLILGNDGAAEVGPAVACWVQFLLDIG